MIAAALASLPAKSLFAADVCSGAEQGVDKLGQSGASFPATQSVHEAVGMTSKAHSKPIGDISFRNSIHCEHHNNKKQQVSKWMA